MPTKEFLAAKRIFDDPKFLCQAGGRWFGVCADNWKMLRWMPFRQDDFYVFDSAITELKPDKWDLLIWTEQARYRLKNTGDINAFRITCESREVRMQYSAADLLRAFEEVLSMARLPYDSTLIIEWLSNSEQAQAFLAGATSKSDLRTLAKVFANEQLTLQGGNEDDRRAARVAMGPYERDFWRTQNLLRGRPPQRNVDGDVWQRNSEGDIVGMSLDGRPAPQLERLTIKKSKVDKRPAHGQKRAYFDD